MSPIYRSYQFASGSALAVVHFFGIKRISNPNLFASLCFLLFLLNFGLIPNYINFRSGGLLVTLITLVLLHTRFSNTALWNPKTGLTKFLVWKGDVSYEIYLWHWPILVFSELIFSFGNKLFFFLYAYVITLVLSAASRSLVPRWIGNSDGWNLPRFWATISSGFVLISVAIGYFAQFGWERDWALGKHEIIRRDCDAGKISSDCSWYTNEHEEFAYVIGDSMSWAIGDAIIELNHHLGIATIARTRNSCSMGLPSNYNSFECNLWRGRVATEILSQRPKYVAIANADGYTELEKRATKRLINDFIEKKIPVLNISTPPGGDSYSARRSLLLKGPPNRFALRQATQDFEFKQRSSLIQHFDPSEYLCKPLCAIAEKGTEYYNYGAHLSVSGAFYLSPFLKLHIVELLKT